jgi:hypothetical protein
MKTMVDERHREMFRTRGLLCVAACTAVLLGSVLVAERSTALGDPYSFLRTHVGFDAKAVEKVRRGEPIAIGLDTPIARELAVFGVVWIEAPVERYIERYRDIERFEADASVRIKKLSEPPQPSDFSGLTLTAEDFRELRDCTLGNCDVKLGQDSMARLREEVDWSAPDAKAVVTRLLKRLIFDYAVAYQREGNQSLAVYRDKSRPISMAREFEGLLGNVSFLPIYAPELHRYLLDYPRVELSGSEEFFYWSTNEFGLKPTTRLNHVVIHRQEETDSVVIASKHIYGSHYFHAALELRILFVDPDRSGGFYLMTLNRSRSDGLEGFLGMFRRRPAQNRARDSLLRFLEHTKLTMEES